MRPRDVALALLVVLLWGVNFVVIKLGLRGVSPFVLGGLRMLLTSLPAVFFIDRPRLPKPRTVYLAGTLIAAIGLASIGLDRGTSFPLAGFLLTLRAAASWAVGNLISRSLSRYGPVNGLALAWAFEGPEAVAASVRAMDAGSWAAVAYLAFGATLAGFGLWNRLLKAHPAAQATRFALLVPVVGLACGAVVFGERISAAQLRQRAGRGRAGPSTCRALVGAPRPSRRPAVMSSVAGDSRAR